MKNLSRNQKPRAKEQSRDIRNAIPSIALAIRLQTTTRLLHIQRVEGKNQKTKKIRFKCGLADLLSPSRLSRGLSGFNPLLILPQSYICNTRQWFLLSIVICLRRRSLEFGFLSIFIPPPLLFPL